MNDRCWRNTVARVNVDHESTWPQLPDSNSREKWPTREIARARTPRLHVDSIAYSEDIEISGSLDETDYPKLGLTVSKRKHIDFSEFHQLEIVDNCFNRGDPRVRTPRSTDLIQVDLQKTLETQCWPIPLTLHPRGKRTVDICKLNVNMSVSNPLSKSLITKLKRKVTFVENKRKLSRLKSLILYERMARKQSNLQKSQISKSSYDSTSKFDVSGINLESLRISVVPRDDPELLKKMSALSFLGTNYRDSRETNIAEESVIFRPDLHERMKNMSIDVRNDLSLPTDGKNDPAIQNTVFIDADTLRATESLKICDGTEGFTENVRIKEEPIEGIKFTKKFREYCTNTITPNLRIHLDAFLAEISRLQKRMYERDNVKGKRRRRYCAGIKEVQKHIDLKKIKFVVIAPDLEKVGIEGGLDDALSNLLARCKRCEVPYCFGLGRRKLGYYIHGKGFVSCIGILNYGGAEEKLRDVLLEVVEARNDFLRLMSAEAKTIDVEKFLPKEELLPSEIINAYFKILASTS